MFRIDESKTKQPFSVRAERYLDCYQPADNTIPVHPSEFESVMKQYRGLYTHEAVAYRLRLMGVK